MTGPSTRASHASLHELASELAFDEATYERAFELGGFRPGPTDWRRWMGVFLLALGATLVVAGITAFFAWNWAALDHLGKFGLIETGIVVAVIAAWRLGIDAPAGATSLFVAAFLVGVLFAVYGQVYQTGADPYGLFLSWGLLVLPWAIVGRQQGLWLLVIVLANLAIIMYWTQVLDPPEGLWMLAQLLGPVFWLGALVTDSELSAVIFSLNALALVAWEVGAARGYLWMRGSWLPRIVAFIALATVLPPTLLIIFAASFEAHAALSLLSPLLLGIAAAACVWYYQYRKHDLFILTCCAFAVILVVTSLAIRVMMFGFGSLLLLAALLIAQVAGAAFWLRDVARRWEQET